MLCSLVLGGMLSEILSFAAELLLFLIDRYRHFPKKSRSKGSSEGRQLLQITLPMAFTAYLRSGLITLQHILIPEGLRKSGRSHAHALTAYGSIHSMALPIILYPSALISSFSGLLIPTLAECRVSNSKKRICYMISRVWSLSMLFSVAVAGILSCFSSEFSDLLYPNTETEKYIRILAPLIPIMYIDTATDAMLKGLGEQLYSMKINILDASISVILVWSLVPIYGITGYLITVYVSECFNTVCSISRLLGVSGTAVRLLKWVYKPLVSIVLATSVMRWLLTSFASGGSPTVTSLTLHCLGTLGFYLFFLLLLGSIAREDLDWLGTVLLPIGATNDH
jgi:stage V sporulation protein B